MLPPPVNANVDTNVVDSCNCCSWWPKKRKHHQVTIESDEHMHRVEVVFDEAVTHKNPGEHV